jgi:hypothetical protein
LTLSFSCSQAESTPAHTQVTQTVGQPRAKLGCQKKMNRDFFTHKENWYGSFYELAIELQPSHDNVRLERALDSLWSHPNLSGHWVSIENFGRSPDVFNISDQSQSMDQNSLIHLYGVFSIPEIDKQLGCLSIVVRETEGSDWLDFSFPTKMLESAFGEIPWSTVVDKYLLQIADMIYQQTPYDLALIGEEVSGLVNKASITEKGIANEVKFYGLDNNKVLISPAFWSEMSLDKAHEVMPSGLRWATFA